ncbi:MAG: acyltransferase [Clostridia bacterium]|nr:acyltransferase [Clostridia bacterium]
MEKVQNKERKSNFELLRIFAMILIILHHYSLHGGLFKIDSTGINKFIGTTIYFGGKLGVNLFVILSGYFLINSKFKCKKVLKLILQVLFYTIGLISLYIVIKGMPETNIIKKSFFPITYGTYWFFTIYIGLYVLSPFINKFLNGISKKNLGTLLVILTFMFSILGTVTLESKFMGNLQWFVFLYMVGAYINLYDFPKISKKIFYLLSIFGLILIIGIVNLITYISIENSNHFSRIYQIVGMNYLLTFIESICIFMTFKNFEVKNNKIINVLGKSSFGVYLFHENMFREFFWKKLLKVEMFYFAEPYWLILHIIGCTIGIYLVGTLIELVRAKVIEGPIFKINKFDKWFEKIDNCINCE